MKIDEFYSRIKEFLESPEKYRRILNRYEHHFDSRDFALYPLGEDEQVVISSRIPKQYTVKFSLVDGGETLEVSHEVAGEPFSKYFPKVSILMAVMMDLFDYCISLENRKTVIVNKKEDSIG